VSLSINREIVLKIMNDGGFEKELSDILNEELAKGMDMDDELVSDCVNALTYLKNDDAENAADAVLSNKKIIRICHKKNYVRQRLNKGVAAAAILLVLTGAVTFTVNPAYAKEVKNFVVRIVQSLSTADEKTFEAASDVTSLYATFSEQPKMTINNENEINLDSMQIYAVTSSGKEVEIPLSECEVTKEYLTEGSEKRILLIVSYKGCSFSIIYTLEG